MSDLPLRRSFVFFHIILGGVVIVKSCFTAVAAFGIHSSNPLGNHLVPLALLEAAAAVLFLVPKTLKIGSTLLIAIFLLAVAIHGIQHEIDLLVFATGVFFVSRHGSAYSTDLFRRQQAVA